MRTAALHKLTARAVQSAGDGMHSDGGGLFLRVKGNARAWVFRFTRDGKKREMGLGSAAAVSLASARDKAAQARDAVGAGLDPIDSKGATPAAPKAREAMTFEAAMRRYIQSHHRTWSSAKHTVQWETSLRNHAPALMRLNVSAITTADVEDTLLPIWLIKFETASRVRQRIERVLSASIARGDRPAPNPAGWRDNLEHILPSQKRLKNVQHHAAVSWQDAPAAFQSILAKRDVAFGYQALITLILSALRSGEVRSMQWDDLKPDHILIPAIRMKARTAHRVALSPVLADHLARTHRMVGTTLVHHGQNGKPMAAMTLTRAMRGAGLGDYTSHGWRSTFSDWANAQGWSRDLIEDALAHQIGSEVERAYRRGDFLDRRQELSAAWGDYLVK